MASKANVGARSKSGVAPGASGSAAVGAAGGPMDKVRAVAVFVFS